MVSNLTPSFTPPKQNSAGIAKRVLDTPMGEHNGQVYTVRDYLEAESLDLANMRGSSEAKQVLETLNALSRNASANGGQINASISAVRGMAETERGHSSRFEPCPVVARHIEVGGKGYDDAHDTYAAHASTARVLEGLNSQLAALAQSQSRGAPGRL